MAKCNLGHYHCVEIRPLNNKSAASKYVIWDTACVSVDVEDLVTLHSHNLHINSTKS